MQTRRNIRIWLGLLGIAVALLLVGAIGGTVSPALALAVSVGYSLIAIASLVRFRLSNLRQPLQRVTAVGLNARMSDAARRAAQRARNRGETALDVTLVDLGLVMNQKRRDGVWQPVGLVALAALDDGAIQPFVRVNFAAGRGERLALVEFAIFDQAGNKMFSHEMKQWVRDGDNLLTCERLLPLQDNPDLGRAGVWDLRLTVDGIIAGVHGFTMQSAQNRSDRPRSSRLAEIDAEDAAVSEPPISLEDLLREERRRN